MLVEHDIIVCDRVEAAMRAFDRKDFCQKNPYYDCPQQIGEGQIILSFVCCLLDNEINKCVQII